MSNSPKLIFTCAHENCNASYDRHDRFETHVRSHFGERPFICDYENCGKAYTSISHLKRHAATHEVSSFRCPEENCGEILKSKETLRKHLDCFHCKKKHKQYKCTMCDKEFNKHNWLQRHMFHHTGEHPHKCPQCGKGFLMPSRLKRHMKIHEGYKCKKPDCNKVFPKWTLYQTHVKEAHPKVHKCEICERTFSTSFNLKTHKEVHRDIRTIFPCIMPDCSRFYYSEKNLAFHIRSYHQKRPYICDKEFCSRAFTTEEKLQDHMLRHKRRKPRKKKKPKPSFAAILSGCADHRKYTRPSKSKQETSESAISDEFSDSDQNTSYTRHLKSKQTPSDSGTSDELDHTIDGNANSLFVKSSDKPTDFESNCTDKLINENTSNSSEYETITVSVNSVEDHCVESDGMSCISEVEDIVNLSDMYKLRER